MIYKFQVLKQEHHNDTNMIWEGYELKWYKVFTSKNQTIHINCSVDNYIFYEGGFDDLGDYML